MTYGFILTRKVISERTNRYWNESVAAIRRLYPDKEIVVIDDNSNEELTIDNSKIENVRFIKSEFVGAGELLPYYYLHKYRFFPKAIILHDSVFFQKKINFDLFSSFPVMPLWHFNYQEDRGNAIKLIARMTNTHVIRQKLSGDTVQAFSFKRSDKWRGCFGCQAFISLDFIDFLQKKYNLISMVHLIKTRKDRCSLERIIGVIFNTEFPFLTNNKFSLLGDIWRYQKWGLKYEEYVSNKEKFKNFPILKVWTGR